ncbi:MAG TPA: MlaD family protein [Candidatus Acidoferrales bacterium]|nr:MlaD family protein [Candidatus Acidoferrales bacterium]
MGRVFRLGILMLTALLVLAGGVFLIGEQRFMFRRTYQLQAEFPNVAGLDNGAEVRVGGIHLGTVRQISLPQGPDGELTVVMELSNSTLNIIRKDSVARIKTEGVMGSKYVEITFGSEKAPEIVNGDRIKGEPPVDFSEAALAATNQAKAAATAFTEDAEALKQNFLLRGYFKRRGYEDTSDLAKNKIARVPGETISKEFEYDAKELFDKSDDAKLKNQKALREAGKFLEEHKFRLAVVASSAETGDSAKDQVLTEARAKVVRDYLVQNFKFDDTRVKVIGLGKSAGANRVTILIYSPVSAAGPQGGPAGNQ